MARALPRFECLQEAGGTWMVWDHEQDAPATLGGYELRGRQKVRAESARDILTRIFNNRMDAQAVRNSRPD